MKNLESITAETEMLTANLKRINDWVAQNPDTDPNYYEYIEQLVRFGELAADVSKYFDQVGWPTDEKGKELTHYDAWRSTPELETCHAELLKLAQARENGKKGFTDPDTNPEAVEFLRELRTRCTIGEYFTSNDPDYRKMKQKLICMSFSVPFYIWQVQRKEPNYQYDNSSEFDTMKKMRDLNVSLYPTQYSEYDKDDNLIYEGPQFGNYIDAMFDQIEKSYKYSDAKGAKEEKPVTYVKK